MTISLSFGNDARMASRVPSTMRAWPWWAASQCSMRSPSDRLLCRVASMTPGKRARILPSSWGVRLISGTRIRICASSSRASTWAQACRYTSVLPLPVTPYSRVGLKPWAPPMASAASCWAAFRAGMFSGVPSCASASLPSFLMARSSATVVSTRKFFGKPGSATSPSGRW
ncbi:hypothetical protein D3C72_1509400 [compost metagenome]